jgi:hypothetical protein
MYSVRVLVVKTICAASLAIDDAAAEIELATLSSDGVPNILMVAQKSTYSWKVG